MAQTGDSPSGSSSRVDLVPGRLDHSTARYREAHAWTSGHRCFFTDIYGGMTT